MRRGAAILALAVLAAALPATGAAQGPAPRASAALAMPADCPRTRTVRLVVTGSEIERVTFRLDGRRVSRLFDPNAGTRWRYRRLTRSLSFGRHTVVARVVFSDESRRPAATLRGSFRRCR